MIFNWILETSISASILVLIILGIRMVIKNKVSPSILYYMWFVVIIKLVVPNGPESQISLYNIFSKREASVEEELNNLKSININEEINVSEEMNISEEINIESILRDGKDELYKTQINNKIDYLTLKEALCILWGLGVFILIIRSAYSYISIRKSIKGKEYHDIKAELILLENLKILSLKSKVRIILSNKFESPGLVGVIKPRIIIPENIMKKSSSEELKYILLHELTHLKRKDNIIIWFSLIIKIIYWFNPIIIFSMHLMQKDCELSCDANVLNKIDSKENIDYGMSILKVLSSISSGRKDIGVIAMIRNKKDVKERINMISKNKKYGVKSLIIGCALIGLLCGVGLTSKTLAESKNKGTITEENSNDVVGLKNKSSEVTKENDIIIDENINEVVNGKINSNIIVYNTHYEEGYVRGDDENLTVVDAAKMLSSKLKESGLDSRFLENTKDRFYDKAWDTSKELLVEKVEKYGEKMLIDIHRSGDKDDENRRVIKVMLSKDSPRYEENKEFANKLLNEVQLQGVTVNMSEVDESIRYLNLDLAGESIYLEVGSPASNKSDIEFCISKIAEAIKNIN